MQTLSHRDWQRLNDVAVDLHSIGGALDLPVRILDGLRWAIPCDSASLQDDDGGALNVPWVRDKKIEWQSSKCGGAPGMRVMPRWSIEYIPFREAWLSVSAERHPHTDYFKRTADGSAHRLTDLVSMRQLQKTRFYNELARPSGLSRQLTIYIHLPTGSTLSLAVCRRLLEFSDTECAILDLLRPHVQIAWQRFRRSRLRSGGAFGLPDNGADLRHLGITEREAEVLRWIAEGKTNPEICIILNLRPSTTKTHVAHLLAKLGCENRTTLARMAIEAIRN